MEKNWNGWKFEVKFGKRKMGGICPVCWRKINHRGDGGIDKSGRVMGAWTGCGTCGTAFPRGEAERMKKGRS